MDNLEEKLYNLKSEEYEIPTSVSIKIENAFDKIRKEDKSNGIHNKKKWIVAAAGVLILTSVCMTPQVGKAINEFIFHFSNPGIENAKSNNYVQYIDDKSISTDKVDIKLSNIIADSSKIILDYEMNFKGEDVNLNLDEKYLMYSDFSISDEKGNSVERSSNIENGGARIAFDEINGIEEKFEKDNMDSKKGHYRIMLTSNYANIPKISKLNIKFNKLVIEQLDIDENLNWETNIILDEKFCDSKKINYKWKDSEKIKVNKEETLPTGTVIEFIYYIKDKELLSGGFKMKLKTEDGKEYHMSGANLETNADGYNYHILFDGLTSFDNVNKFTLEFEKNNSVSIDKVEFTK